MNFEDVMTYATDAAAAWTWGNPYALGLGYLAGVIVTMFGIRLRWPKWSEPAALALFCWYLILPVLLLMLAWRGMKLGWRALTWPVRVFARGLKRGSEWEKWSAQWQHITTMLFPLDGDGLMAGLVVLSKHKGELTTNVKAVSLGMPTAGGNATLKAEFNVRQGDKQWPAIAEASAGRPAPKEVFEVRPDPYVPPLDFGLRSDDWTGEIPCTIGRRDVPPEIIDDEEGVAPVREGAPPAYGSKLPEREKNCTQVWSEGHLVYQGEVPEVMTVDADGVAHLTVRRWDLRPSPAHVPFVNPERGPEPGVPAGAEFVDGEVHVTVHHDYFAQCKILKVQRQAFYRVEDKMIADRPFGWGVAHGMAYGEIDPKLRS